MNLAIADPPYPPNLLSTGHGTQTRADRWYGDNARAGDDTPGDHHPEAADWNDPARHRALLAELIDLYDGWAIATMPDAVAMVYPPLPRGCKIMVWHKLAAMPTANRIASQWEAVIVYPPPPRRSRLAADAAVPDVLRCAPPGGGFAGAKPRQWSRWVLDALGYDPAVDTVVDLFPGSGAVSAEIAQGVLL